MTVRLYNAGYTLFEALLAFAILGLTLTFLFQAVGGKLVSAYSSAADYARLELAKSLLAEFLATQELEEHGVYQKHWVWDIKIEPVEISLNDAVEKNYRLERVTIDISNLNNSKIKTSHFIERIVKN